MKKKYKVLILLLIILIVLINLYSIVDFFDTYGKYRMGSMDEIRTYVSTDNNYSISIPVAWEIHKIVAAPDNLSFLSETMNTSNPKASILVSSPRALTLSKAELIYYAETYRNGFEQVNMISEKDCILGKNKGRLIEYAYVDYRLFGSFTNHCYDWIVAKNDGYVFTFCVDEKTWLFGEPMYLTMIKSITVR